MSARTLKLIPVALLSWIGLAAAFGGPLTVADQKGRTIDIEIVRVTDNSVTFRRAGGPTEFTLPLANFNQASQDLIRKQASALPAAPPKLQADVVLGKRRRDKGDSYYMVKQEITSTVKLSNLSPSVPVAGVHATLVYIGQNTRTPDLYSVLNSQEFEASIEPGTTHVKEMEAFSTTYDSDNKGTNNIGGYQYFDYVLVVTDAGGNVVLTEATAGSFKLALAARPNLAKEVVGFAVGKTLTERLEAAKETSKLRVPR